MRSTTTLSQPIIFNYLETTSTPRLDDPTLRLVLTLAGGGDEKLVSLYCSALLGERHAWQTIDFGAQQGKELRVHNLQLLSWEWLGDTWQRRAVPITRGAIAREALITYQIDQGEKGRATRASSAPAYHASSGCSAYFSTACRPSALRSPPASLRRPCTREMPPCRRGLKAASRYAIRPPTPDP